MPRLSLHVDFSIILRVSLLAVLLTACAAPTDSAPRATVSAPQPTATPEPAPFRIVAYVTEGVVESVIPYDQLTHINYSFLTPKADGSFNPILSKFKLRTIVENAHQHNVRVLISVGGWGWDQQFETVAASPELRGVFIQNLNAFVTEFQLDGVDLDWEYPTAGEQAQNFLLLIRELRAVMPDKEITTAVVAHGENGMGILPETFEIFDFVNIMTYDGSDHGSMEQFQTGLEFWSARGLPKEKIVMGIPFYGDPDVPYRKLVENDPAAAQVDSYDYYGKVYYYNGVPTVQAKTELALAQAGGIMFWTLDFDIQGEYSLVNVIYKTAYP
jgi:GH18 family chitinase